MVNGHNNYSKHSHSLSSHLDGHWNRKQRMHPLVHSTDKRKNTPSTARLYVASAQSPKHNISSHARRVSRRCTACQAHRTDKRKHSMNCWSLCYVCSEPKQNISSRAWRVSRCIARQAHKTDKRKHSIYCLSLLYFCSEPKTHHLQPCMARFEKIHRHQAQRTDQKKTLHAFLASYLCCVCTEHGIFPCRAKFRDKLPLPSSFSTLLR